MAFGDFIARLLGKSESKPSDNFQQPAPTDPAAKALFEEYAREISLPDPTYNWSTPPSRFSAGKKILEGTEEEQIAVLGIAYRTLMEMNPKSKTMFSGDFYQVHARIKALVSQLLRRDLPLDEATLIEFLNRTTATRGTTFDVPWAGLLRVIEKRADHQGLRDELIDALKAARGALTTYSGADLVPLRERLDALLAGKKLETFAELAPGDAWADLALEDLGKCTPEVREAWQKLLDHSVRASGTSPSKKWLATAGELLKAIGTDSASKHLVQWLDAVPQTAAVERRTAEWKPTSKQILDPHNAEILKGLAWLGATFNSPSMANALGTVAESCFKKVPGYGPRSPKVANACVAALTLMTIPEAASQLSRLKARVKHASSLGQVSKALDRAAERAGVTADELEESTVGTFDLDSQGRRRWEFGGHVAELVVAGPSEVRVAWSTSDGKALKSLPAAVKKEHAEPLRELKRVVDDLEKTLFTIRHRLERSPLDQREWRFNDWRQRYVDHPVASIPARRLIWRFETGGAVVAGLWRGTAAEDVEGVPLAGLGETTRVRLWHSIEASADVVLAWRKRLESLEITQPFKQAHREVYIVTDAERRTGTYSNRFAAHILRQHQFAELCRQRRWQYRLQGDFDSANTPTLELPKWDLKAEYWVESQAGELGGIMHSGIYAVVSSDQVRFIRGREPVRMEDVPPIVFSEVMRDVDLFVGVCSIGADPTWADQGNRPADQTAYWQAYSLGELSEAGKSRGDVLRRLIPRLKIADRCEVTDRFLVVKGEYRTYKIHLGSGNILMEPNNQYLCIVPSRGASAAEPGGRIFLPFEGDSTLSVILSKAFLLAEDTKIKDPTIVRQIR